MLDSGLGTTMPGRSSDLVFRFDAFEVDLGAVELRKAGTRLKLQEQPWQVLVALLERAGQVVTRDELRERLWPTETFVDFDHSLNIAINKVRDALGDEAAKPRFIETVPRRGYRFITPVERIAPRLLAPADTRRWLRFDRVVVACASVLVLSAGGIAWRSLTTAPGRHVIAVLPLRNLNAGPDTEYFSDGLTDEIIYNLSIIDGLEVKSGSSSFVFKGKAVDAREAGRQLGCDLVLEGTLLRGDDRLRLNIQLVRVADDVPVWSQQYDRAMRDIFTVQDEVSRAIVNELRLKEIGRAHV